jgi:hypothetical protein
MKKTRGRKSRETVSLRQKLQAPKNLFVCPELLGDIATKVNRPVLKNSVDLLEFLCQSKLSCKISKSQKIEKSTLTTAPF